MVIEEHAALDVITKDGSTYAIDESQIIRGSLTTSQSCSSGGGIPAGSCNTGTASVAFHAPNALSYEKLFGAKVKLYVWYGDASKKQVGVYNVTSTERSYGVYTLSLSDNVYLLDEACYSNDTTTAAQNWLAMQLGEKRVPSVIFNMVCNAYNVPHWNAAKNEEAVPESGNYTLSVKVPNDCCTESVKDFANYLAEYLGAIIMPDENGKLHFAYMGSRTCPITIDSSNIERGTYQKSPFHVSTSSWRVNHDSGIWSAWRVVGDLPDNAAPLSIVVNNNPFWQSVEDETPESMVCKRTENMLRYMWVAQGKVAYIDNVPQINPFRCTVHVPYYFRAGDRVKIIDPITSYVYHSYVTDVTWTFRGGQQISCAGEDTRTLSVSTSRNGAKKMSDYSRYLYRKSKSNTGSVEANTYTKAEIDAKDATVKSAADKAQVTADGAVSVNNTQNTQIAALQKSAHTHSNKGVLDKIEQPYTTAERDKLAGLENYTHPTHTAHTKGFYKFANDGLGHVSDAEKVTKDDIVDLGIPGSIPIYNVDVDEEYGYSEGMIIATIVVNQTAHPIVVPIIGENENADYGLMSASDKTKLDGISDNANNYVHPTTSGNKHIPSGGSSGQILRWSADGTAVWGADNNTTYSDATQSTHGLMTAADKKKLDDLAHAESISSLVFKNDSSKTYMGVKFSANRVSARFLIMENNGRRADIQVSIRIGIDTKAIVYACWNTDTEFRIFYDNEDYIYVVFNCSAWSRGSCISTIENAIMTKWNGTSYPSNLTAIATDIRYTLDSVNFTRYALAKDGTAVAAAKLSTARKINTIPFDGTKDITIPRSGMVCHEAEGTVGQQGYVKIATIKITAQYANMPTIIYYRNRGAFPVKLVIMFSNSDTIDPGLYVLEQTVELVNYNWKRAYMNKTAAGMWDLIIAKSEAWDSVQILDCQPAKHVSVTFTNAHISALPSTAVTSTVYERAMVTSTVAAAKTLTDSGWIATTKNTSFTATSTVKCRKYGQIVEVRGEVTFNSTYGSPTVCTLPAGYRPAEVVQTCGYTPSGKIFGIKVDTAGVVSFSSDAAGTFVKSTTYRIDLTYLLG